MRAGESKKKYELKGIIYCVYSVRFWQYTFMILLCCFSPTFFGYSYKTYGEQKSPHPPISDTLLTWAASIGAGFINGISRVVFGYLMDHYSFKTLFGWLTIVAMVNACLQYWAAWNAELYFLCIMINYAYIGGVFAIFPTTV